MILRWSIWFSLSCCAIECMNIHHLSRKVFQDSCPCLPKDICPSVLGSSERDIDFFGKISTCPEEDLVKCCSASSNYMVAQRKENKWNMFANLTTEPSISHNYGTEVSLATTTDNISNSNEIETQYLETNSTNKKYLTTISSGYDERTEWKTTTEYQDITTEENIVAVTENKPDLESSTLGTTILESTSPLYNYPTISIPNVSRLTTTQTDDSTFSRKIIPTEISLRDKRIRLREFLKKRSKIPITTTKRPVKSIQNLTEKRSSHDSVVSNDKTNSRNVLYTKSRPRESFLKKKQQQIAIEKTYSVKPSVLNSEMEEILQEFKSDVNTQPNGISTDSPENEKKFRKPFRGNKKFSLLYNTNPISNNFYVIK